MKISAHIVLFGMLTLVLSCEKKQSFTPTPGADNSTLAAAQLVMAQNHLQKGEPQLALPYLQASVTNNPTSETKRLFTETLASSKFSVPTLQLEHPYPVLAVSPTNHGLIAAIGGPYPTLINWNLTGEPFISSVLFPRKAKSISHLLLSPSQTYLSTQRDNNHLICRTDTLQPIAAIPPFPAHFDAHSLLSFSENSLLFAHPAESANNTLTWYIRDLATGESLRSEVTSVYPRPTLARFDDTTLHIFLEDGNTLSVPIIGEVVKTKTKLSKPNSAPSNLITFSDKTITLRTSIYTSSSVPLDMLTGFRLDPIKQSLSAISTSDRLAKLSEIFPQLPSKLNISSGNKTLELRLAAAFPEDFSEIAKSDLKLAQDIRGIFATNDNSAIMKAIETLPPSGLPTATALYLACETDNLEVIHAILTRAENIPSVIKQFALGESNMPDIGNLRESQDWLGYEAPDFVSLFEKLDKQDDEILSSLTLKDPLNPAEIEVLLNKLLDPEIQRKIGIPAILQAATVSALKLAPTSEHAFSSLRFAAIAERARAHPTVILRIRGTAHTSLSEFKTAHSYWIELISKHPENTHLPSDYSEAAYTAFELDNTDQAIEILNTGVFRFPRDVSLSLRAGQIAMLTNHPEQAVHFFKHTTSLGIPPDEIENTTALLAIAHAQLGDQETAASYLDQVSAIDPSWKDPDAVSKLPWPDFLIDTLRELIVPEQEIEPLLLPENDLIDKVPLPEELPILEPDLSE